MAQIGVEAGDRPGLTKDERSELVRLRRENRVQAMEIEILKRASAYFAKENVGTAPGFVDSLRVRIAPHWKDQHHAEGVS